jgi:hypothetical protein
VACYGIICVGSSGSTRELTGSCQYFFSLLDFKLQMETEPAPQISVFLALSLHGFAVFVLNINVFFQTPSSKHLSPVMDFILKLVRRFLTFLFLFFYFFLALNSATYPFVIFPHSFVQYGHTALVLYF